LPDRSAPWRSSCPNTETADAACGDNPWANTFLDTFRYLDQLGRLARQDVRVVAHNTLVASDYGPDRRQHVRAEADNAGPPRGP
jgi:hypothetical protein